MATDAEKFENENPLPPFPIHLLPDVLREFVQSASHAHQTDIAMVALPTMAAVAASVGNSRLLRVHNDWHEACALWCLIVSPGGTMKSKLLKVATEPTVNYEARLQLEYRRKVTRWKEEGKKDDEPLEPHRFVDDFSIEKVVDVLACNPKGVLMCATELGNFIGNFTRYSSGRSSGVAAAAGYNRMFDGDTWKVGRLCRRTPIIHRALASMAACVQPKLLPSMLTDEFANLGFNARFLIAQPPRPELVPHSERQQMPARVREQYSHLVRSLHELTVSIDDYGRPVPVAVICTPKAAAALDAFRIESDRRSRIHVGKTTEPIFNRIHGHAARLALMLHMAEFGDCLDGSATLMDEETALAGIELARWFLAEGVRIYSQGAARGNTNEAFEVVEWIKARSEGRVTVRELQQGWRKYETAEAAKEVLNLCQRYQLGYWSPNGKTDHFVPFQ